MFRIVDMDVTNANLIRLQNDYGQHGIGSIYSVRLMVLIPTVYVDEI